LKAIDDNARELIQLISNMIEYQKFASGKPELDKQKNDIKKIIHEAHLFFSAEFDSRGMKINSTFSKPLWIECDRARMHQVLTNLLQVSLYSASTKSAKIIVNVWEKENEVEISIRTNGETLSNDDLDEIFSDFYKVDTSNIRSNGGIGLSLALCKKIIDAHGGKIEAINDEIGMKITFTLPK
ncbi:MAG TPA: HAMP domain-containing sensor histidine kinase, partial [Nitrosopumilaceae archaeon]|nr:HAMP domain-containing sensor histidine kinase [Nitrosopumilaceae archaeon]